MSTNLNRRQVLSATGAAIVAGIGVSGQAAASSHGDERRYSAELTGDEQVPPVETDASGHATFETSEDGTAIEYELHVESICNVTQAHVHLGERGENGPVVAWLHPEDGQEPELVEGRFDGTLAAGTITEGDLVGPLDGASFEEAAESLEGEGAYVNVHTEQHPDGEIRGQIRSDHDVAHDGPPEESEEEEPDGRPVRITVTNVETGDPIEGAEVRIASADTDPDDAVEFNFTTDTNGVVNEVLEIGNFTLTIESEGYRTYRAEVGLEEEHHAELDPEDGTGESELSVSNINVSTGRDVSQESVTFQNTGSGDLDLDGWSVTDREDGGTGSVYTFSDFTLEAGAEVELITGEGSDTDDTVYWGLGAPRWNQDGDTIVVTDANGNEVLSHEYGGGAPSIQIFLNQVRSLFA